RRPPRAADGELGMERGDGGEDADADADGRRAARQAGAARSRARSVHRSRRAAEDLRRPRVLVAQRDVGEEPPAAVPRVVRMADRRIGERRERGYGPPGLLMRPNRVLLGVAIALLVAVPALAQGRR